MKYDADKEEFIMESGRRFAANCDIIGLGVGERTRGISGGYDQRVTFEVGVEELWAADLDPVALTVDEKREIASYMIERWAEWADVSVMASK